MTTTAMDDWRLSECVSGPHFSGTDVSRTRKPIVPAVRVADMSTSHQRGRRRKGKRQFKPRLSRVDQGLIERLTEVMDSIGSTSASALAIGRSEGALRKWLRGKSEPAASDIRRLCETSGYSVEWVLFGMDLLGRCERENRILEGTVRLRPK